MPQADPQAPPTPSAGGGAQAKAADMAGQAQESAQQATQRVQDQIREQIGQRSSQVAEQIKGQASDLRSVGESLREQDKEGPAKAADRLAEYAEKVSRYLNGKDADALLADAEEVGRRQPWAVAVGGLVVGLAGSRFLKASSGARYQSRQVGPQRLGLPATAVSGNGPGPSAVPGPLAAGAVPGGVIDGG
jgi:hypothetical protein